MVAVSSIQLLAGQLIGRTVFNDVTARVDLRIAQQSEPFPGQFYMLCSAAGFLPRPFSIHDFRRDNEGTVLSFLLQRYGAAVQWMLEAPVGSTWTLWGPLGKGFRPPTEKKLIAVAGGVGIAPFLWLDRCLKRNGSRLTLLAGFRDRSSRDLMTYHQDEGVNIQAASESGEFGQQGIVTSLLTDQILGERAHLMVCGPPPMMRAVAMLAEKTDTSCELSMEETMACGVGACLGCAIPTPGGVRLCCQDGPVVAREQIDWKRYHV